MPFFLEVFEHDGTIRRIKCPSERCLVIEYKAAHQRKGLPSIIGEIHEGLLGNTCSEHDAEKFMELLMEKNAPLKALYER